jgi:hypothetical protein
MDWLKRLTMMLDIILHTLLSAAKWVLPLAVIVALVFFLQEIRIAATAVMNVFTSSAPEKPLKERDADAKDKCRAYTMLADLAGSKTKLEQDKIRVLCTVIRLEEIGVDACDIFHDQKELVPPGWGRRTTGVYNPILGRYTYVPKRRLWYVEGEFSQAERDAATVLSLRVKDQKLCPADWKATTIVRPNREGTVGNQRADELAAIKKMVPQKVDSKTPSEFEFYYPKEP